MELISFDTWFINLQKSNSRIIFPREILRDLGITHLSKIKFHWNREETEFFIEPNAETGFIIYIPHKESGGISNKAIVRMIMKAAGADHNITVPVSKKPTPYEGKKLYRIELK